MTAYAVARKELLEVSRDRRSLFSGLFYGVWAPLVMAIALVAMARDHGAIDTMTIAVEGASRAPALGAYLKSRNISVTPAPDDIPLAIRERQLPIALILDPEYSARFAEARPAPITLMFDSTWTTSSRQAAHMRSVLTDYGRSVGQTRLVLRGVAPAVAAPVRVHERDFSTAAGRAGRVLAMLPIFVLLAAFVGGMSVAADLGAGERERGSLESLLLHPAGRFSIAAGKWATVALVSLATIAVALGVTQFVLSHPRVQSIDLPIGFSGRDALTIFMALAPLALFASAVQLLVAFRARTYKEAQTQLTTLMFVPMLPGFLLAFGSLKPAWWMAVTPILGQHLLLADLIQRKALAPVTIAVLCVLTALAAAGALVATSMMLGRETVLRRTGA